MNQIESFYRLSAEYCKYVTENEINYNSIPFLMELLMKLYISALNLPDLKPETIQISESTIHENICIRINKEIPTTYWEIFNPYMMEEPVCGDLADDLCDILSDLQNGIKEYERGKIGNAVFEWKFGLNNHWGNHAVAALRALHSIITQ